MTGIAITSSAQTAVGRPCLACGYDLRGLGDDGNCPECGLAVARSAVPGDELRHAPPRWLTSLAWGAGLVLGSMVASVVFLRFVARYLALVSPESYLLVPSALGLVFAAGIWLLTRPQQRFGPSGPAWRWSLRVAALAPLLLTWGNYLALVNVFRAPRQLWLISAGFLALSAIPVLLMLHLRRLAHRLLDGSLAEHCAIVGVIGSASFALAGALLFTGSVVALELTAALGVVLSYLWSLYLLLRFTLALSRARRESAKAWNRVA